ncbi:hypothetical protein L9F63_005492 [Diploptera punctata]|uniref:Ionotropic glutamate receptor C-terminal domain-containing protein n=1 Tax=Diploptera punctata TaxID=6984 RepID=A0AAD7ZD18_DIPPU|nr:hypothetical protein L9F63_005492 [Diploptera punctata]
MLQLCSMFLTAKSLQGLEHSTPWSRLTATFLVPKPQPLSRVLLMYLPLEFWTWIILLNTFLSFSLVLHATAKLLPFSSRYQSIHICFLDASRILLLNSLPKLPRQTALRYLLVGWAFFSLLTTSVYSSGFTSLLTSPLYSHPIDTIQDLLDQNIYWGEPVSSFNYIFTNSDNRKLQIFKNRFKIERGDREKRILEGNYATFCKVLSNTFVTESEKLSPRARQTLRVMKEPMFTFYIGIGLRENSPYKVYIDSTITRLEQAGITDFWQHFIIHKLGFHYMNTFFSLQSDVVHRKPLTLNSLQGAFCFFIIGLIIASFVLISEVVMHNFHNEHVN